MLVVGTVIFLLFMVLELKAVVQVSRALSSDQT
jgi:hypothetical protein